jgi:hypothetical protein
VDLVSKEDLERRESGSHFIPDSVLSHIHVEVMKGASDAYANLVTDNPNYDFNMVYDGVKGGITVYWKRIA